MNVAATKPRVRVHSGATAAQTVIGFPGGQEFLAPVIDLLPGDSDQPDGPTTPQLLAIGGGAALLLLLIVALAT